MVLPINFSKQATPPPAVSTPFSGRMGTKLLTSVKTEEVKNDPEQKSNLKKWLSLALLIAGIALTISGVGAGIGLAALAFHGAVTIMGTTFITLSLKPLAGSLIAFTIAYVGHRMSETQRKS